MDFAELSLKRNRGWPWPEASFGLSSMYGEDGWCRSCGIPTLHQSGPLVLQAKGMAQSKGAWAPHWRYDSLCLSEELALETAGQFSVDLREVGWRNRDRPDKAFQIVPAVSPEPWFDAGALSETLVAEHGTSGAECSACGVWRWMPLSSEELPLPTIEISQGDVAATPSGSAMGSSRFENLRSCGRLGS